MDPRSVNFAARRNLGFFLTKGRDSDTNREEHAFFAHVCRKATALLRERRIRPANILSELDKAGVLMDELAGVVTVEAARHKFADLVDPGAALAYASLVMAAALSRYANLMDRRSPRKTNDA